MAERGTAAEFHGLQNQLARRTARTNHYGSRDSPGRAEIHRDRSRFPRRTATADGDDAGEAGRGAAAEFYGLQDQLARRTARTNHHGSRDPPGRTEIHRARSRLPRRTAAADGDDSRDA